ncbi:MAG TPA: hypothetical protein VFZ48_05000 [Candidatus Saccharimonadales bacterium]
MALTGLGITYVHPEHGEREVQLSDYTRSKLELVYASDQLRAALRKKGGLRAQGHGDALKWLRGMSRGGWVLGCSGFATVMPNDTYQLDRVILAEIYSYLKQINALPAFTSDGGTGAGALQANADVADRLGVPTLGCTPMSALPKQAVGARRRTIIGGATYEDREAIVGRLADLLLCIDGKDGTLREAEAAAAQGSIVMFVALRTYDGMPTYTRVNMPQLRLAASQKRIVVWSPESSEDLITAFARALRMREVKGSTLRERLPKIEEAIFA